MEFEMIPIPRQILGRIVSGSLEDIVKMKPSFEIYETANILIKDLTIELKRQQ